MDLYLIRKIIANIDETTFVYVTPTTDSLDGIEERESDE